MNPTSTKTPWLGPFTSAQAAQEALTNAGATAPYEIKIHWSQFPSKSEPRKISKTLRDSPLTDQDTPEEYSKFKKAKRSLSREMPFGTRTPSSKKKS